MSDDEEELPGTPPPPASPSRARPASVVGRKYPVRKFFFTGFPVADKTRGQCLEPGCGAAFAKNVQLRRHTITHTGQLPFACPHADCGAAFLQASRLRVHVAKRHERVYRCGEPGCGATFPVWSQLQKHRTAHLGQACAACGGVVFKTRASYLAHCRDVHAPARPLHPCPIPDCGKTFSRSTNLRVHVRAAHVGAKPFACPRCGVSFAYKKTLDQHAARGHTADGRPVATPRKRPAAALDESDGEDAVVTEDAGAATEL
jgi:uncharacterized C2H2 Zn-finger protein